MTWSWSHTNEAYHNAMQNVIHKDRDWLEVVFAEWDCRILDDEDSDHEGFNSDRYDASRAKAKTLPDDVLAEYIWDRMSEQQECTNGGFEAHCCPYGCGCHMVSFDLEKEDADVGGI